MANLLTVHFVCGFGWGALTGVIGGAWWLLSMLREEHEAERKGPHRAERLPASSIVRRAALGFAAVLIACALLVVMPPPVAAQCPERPVSLTLAILTWHEAGVDALADAASIFAAIDTLSRVRGETWQETACAYSTRALTGRTARAWLAALDTSGNPPVGWPAGASWAVQGPLFGRLLEWCVQVSMGHAPDACDFPPTDWGDPEHDGERIHRGIARGYWYRVHCDGARNTYVRRVAADRGGF